MKFDLIAFFSLVFQWQLKAPKPRGNMFPVELCLSDFSKLGTDSIFPVQGPVVKNTVYKITPSVIQLGKAGAPR